MQIVQAGKVATRRVKLGLTAGGVAEVREGLAGGDHVVAKSGTFLRDGDLVRPVFAPTGKVSEAR